MSERVGNTANFDKAGLVEQIHEKMYRLNQAALIVGGEGSTVRTVFDMPTTPRDDAPMPDWNEEQVAGVYNVATMLGYGADEAVPSGLSGAAFVLEGGKVWKIQAEAAAIKYEKNPRSIIFVGSDKRKIGDDEQQHISSTLRQTEEGFPSVETEYDVAFALSQKAVNAAQMTHPFTLGFGYEVAPGNPVIRKSTGQLKYVGRTAAGQSVELLRIDREDYEQDGKNMYRNQPQPNRVMGIVSEILKAQGIKVPVALMTSGTYAGSREVDVWRAGLEMGTTFGVNKYGRNDIAAIRPTVPNKMPLNQIPGEFRQYFEKLDSLLDSLV